MDAAETPLAPWRLVMSLVAALSGVLLSYHFKLEIERKLVIALCRAIVQLLLLGFLLLSFIFSADSPIIVAIYLSLMLLIAATEVTNRQARTYCGHYTDALLSCLIGGGLTGIYASAIVFNPSPWWNPRVFIPTTGMIIGNSVSGPAVAVDRLLSDVTEKKHETEVRLAFGATSYEALLAPVRAAVLAAMMPNLNMLSIVGVVSIPGMMTGQLLGGSTPLVAAEYQMAILFLIAATTTVSTYLAVVLAIKNAIMSPEQRLTPDRILKKSGPKLSIDVAIWQGVKDTGANMLSCLQQRCCMLAYCAPLWGEARSNATVGANARYNPLPQVVIELQEVRSSATLATSSSMRRAENGASQRAGGELDDAEAVLHRATYEIRSASALTTNGTPILQLQSLNIKSGSLMLFDTDGITFALHRGQRVTLEGSSGLGKTRLLRAMAQLDDFPCGTVTLQGASTDRRGSDGDGSVTLLGSTNRTAEGVQTKKYAALVYAQWRSRVMYIPQALPPLAGTPLELLMEVLAYKSRSVNERGKEANLAELAAAACGEMEGRLLLGAGKMSQQWGTLSGGERQRAIIACGLILGRGGAQDENPAAPGKLSPSRPGVRSEEPGRDGESKEEVVSRTSGAGCVLLLDEPTAACDDVACAAVERVLVQSGVACVIVTHDSRQAERLAHTRILLS